jgi:hypothetical protein
VIAILFYFIIGWWWVGGLEGLFLPFSNSAASFVCWLLLIAWGGLAVRAIAARRWAAVVGGLALILLAAAPATIAAHQLADTCAKGRCL